MTALAPGQYLRLTLGEKPFFETAAGDGMRHLLLVRLGRARATLLNPATLRKITVAIADLERARPLAIDVPPRRLARRIKARAADHRRRARERAAPGDKPAAGYPVATVRAALAVLEQAPA